MRFDGVERSSYFKNKDNKEKIGQSKILRRLFIFLSIIIFVLLICFFIFKEGLSSKEKSVQIKIDLPEKVIIGKETTFLVSVFNQEQTDLMDAELFINFPEGFKLILAEPTCSRVSTAGCFVDFPQIANNTFKDVKIVGEFFNLANQKTELKTRLSFQLKNFSSWFKKEFSQEIIFQNPSINLEIEGPSELMLAEQGDFRLKVINKESENLSLAIVILVPEKFSFINFSPSFNDKRDEKRIWQFNFDGQDEKVIDFSGYFEEDFNDGKIVVQAGIFNKDNIFFPQIEKEHLVKINKPGLVLGLKANNFFEDSVVQNFGDHVLLNLSYRNTGQEKIFEPVFRISFDPGNFVEIEKNLTWSWLNGENNIVLEASVIENNDGFQKIIFSSSKINEINPGQDGEIKIDFKIKNKDILPVEEISQSEFLLSAEASAKIFKNQAMIFKAESNKIKIELK